MNAPVRTPADALTIAGRNLCAGVLELADVSGRLKHGNFTMPSGRQLDDRALVAGIRNFETRLLAFREACAAAAGDDQSDVSDAEGFENTLIDAFDRLFGTSADVPARTHQDVGTVSPFIGRVR